MSSRVPGLATDFPHGVWRTLSLIHKDCLPPVWWSIFRFMFSNDSKSVGFVKCRGVFYWFLAFIYVFIYHSSFAYHFSLKWFHSEFFILMYFVVSFSIDVVAGDLRWAWQKSSSHRQLMTITMTSSTVCWLSPPDRRIWELRAITQTVYEIMIEISSKFIWLQFSF